MSLCNVAFVTLYNMPVIFYPFRPPLYAAIQDPLQQMEGMCMALKPHYPFTGKRQTVALPLYTLYVWVA